MTDAFDRELVALALERGFVTPAQVEACRRLQALPPGDKTLPQLLLEQGHLTMLQFTDLFASAESRAGEQNWFGHIALGMGFVNEAQVVEALAEQADWTPTEDRLRLGQVMLNKGFLTLDQFVAVLRRQGRHVMRCGLCDLRFNVVGWAEGGRASCRTCGTDLAPDRDQTATVRGTIAADAPTIRLERPQERGTPFGRYRLLDEVGRGGMGVVYRAHDPQLDREVAIKILRAGETATEREIGRFHREARAIAKLQHRHIITIHDVGSEGGLHYFAMDFVRGEPLSDFLRRGPRDLRRRVELLRDVADAIEHAHRNGVIHRDLKPANILVERGGRPVVMDFGLAKDAGAASLATQDGTQFGTPWFMSPEQVRGDVAAIGPASDVYGLGVILYLMLADRLPFEGKSAGVVYTQVLSESPPPIGGDAPPDLETICLRALEKEPARRTASAREFAGELGRWLGGAPPRPRRRSYAAPAVAVTLAVAALAAWAIFRDREPPSRADPAPPPAARPLPEPRIEWGLVVMSPSAPGSDAYESGRFDEAAAKARSIGDERLFALATIGRAMTVELAGGDPMPLYEEARRVAEARPAVSVAAGRFLMNHGKGEAARREFEAAIAAGPTSDAYLALAEWLESRGEIEKALDAYTKAIEAATSGLDRARARTARWRLGGATAEDDRAAAIAEFEALGPTAEAAVGLSQVLADRDEAVARLNGAPADDLRVRLARAVLLGATEDLDFVIARRPDCARAYAERGRLRKDERDLLEAIRLNPTDASARLLLASLRVHQATVEAGDPTARFRQAVAAHNEAISLNSEDARAHAALGRTYAAWGKWRLAVRAYTAALNVNPRLPEALRGRADARLQEARLGGDPAAAFDRALDDLRAAPRDAETLRRIGATLHARGLHAEACGRDPTADYRAAVEALEAAGDLEEAWAEMGAVRLRWAQRRGGDAALLERAEADLTRALAVRPRADAYRVRAEVRLARSNWKGAIEDAEAAIRMNPALRAELEPILREARERDAEF